MANMEYQENTENLIDLVAIITDIWHRIREIYWILLLIACFSTVFSVVQEYRNYSPRYEASASFVVSADLNSSSTSYTYYNKITLDQLNASFPYILTSGILSQIVAEDLGFDYVPGVIQASVLDATNLFRIQVTASDPQQAYDILQSVIKNYPSVAKYVVGDTTFKLIDDSGVPSSPINYPSFRRSAISGLFKALIIDILIICAQALLRNTIKTPEDLNKFLNIKYLASLPQEQVKKRSSKAAPRLLLDQPSVSYQFREAMNVLQVRINRIMSQQKVKTLVVTSTLAGEGKTTVACNLARAISQKGYRVLLIDTDFRHPSVGSMLRLKPDTKGLEHVIRGLADPKDVIRQYQDSRLFVLPVHVPQENTSKLYTNGMLKSLIAAYREKMDLIIIDTPPCNLVSDAALAAEYADGVLLVIRQDYAHRDKILEGVEFLSEKNTPIIGCVINGEETGIGSYGYGRYGYGKYGYGKYGYGKYNYGKYGYGSEKTESDK